MAKPIPGKTYTTENGDTWPSIAASAYGDPSKWPSIKKINQTQIKYTDVEEIASGQEIMIPIDNTLAALRLDQLSKGLQ